ncbi:hypothetical protein ACMU_08705 [Actibacterium mucosum KCTC 23349]|uniref:Methyltransferase type 11 domain-containing protein n=1 Tax=Actibacterium mucosum KCTC 23349 TaxID=1454373 RepID=A0A037ZIB4_9RHOB|nr:methyltransferase domain-containing protein [Actibacterium mucosum]KAJ55843.1 hypothetical protein ACMU_08705 [Actibacterium mucosum KCTC 23349]
MPGDLRIFLGQLFRKPGEVVALAPSSEALAREMCRGLSPETGHVAELGPGTGKITRAILSAGVAEKNITAFELNPTFVDTLRGQFPAADIRRAPAQEVGNLPLGELDAVISGLPLLSMPNDVQRAIVEGTFRVLKPGGTFVQFTYGPVPPIAQCLREGLKLTWTKSAKIWGNLPPARVYTFRQG